MGSGVRDAVTSGEAAASTDGAVVAEVSGGFDPIAAAADVADACGWLQPAMTSPMAARDRASADRPRNHRDPIAGTLRADVPVYDPRGEPGVTRHSKSRRTRSRGRPALWALVSRMRRNPDLSNIEAMPTKANPTSTRFAPGSIG